LNGIAFFEVAIMSQAMNILETEELSRSFGGNVAVNRVSLGVRQGEFKSIIGPNGAGKTTLFNLISGMLLPSGGRIFLEGREITRTPAYKRSHAGIGRSFQMTTIFPNLTVLENVRLAVQSRSSHAFNFWQSYRRFKEDEEQAYAILEMVMLGGRELQLARTLSHGDKRKLEIGILLATDPKILLLDEPTAGMSRDEVPGIIEVVQRIKQAGGRTVMLVEHKMDMVMSVSDSVAVMHYGELIADGSPEEIARNETVQSAYLGSYVERT
jgi:branched-chain amino acid transport system ATP-binding protein